MPSDPNQPAYGTREFYQYIGRKGGLATAQKLRTNIYAEMIEVAGLIAEKAIANVYAQGLPSDIASAISVGKGKYDGSGDPEVSIEVDLGDTTNYMDRRGRRSARAFEYGSGIHGQLNLNDDKRYRIYPKKAKALMFPFSLTFLPASKFIGFQQDGKFYGREDTFQILMNGGTVASDKTFWDYVEHPGVEARPYLHPAIKAYREIVRQRLAKAFKAGFLGIGAGDTILARNK